MLNKLKLSSLFWNNYTNIGKFKIIINQGGTYSGKNWDILINILILAITKKYLRITITGQTIPNIKRGALRDLENILKSDTYSFFNNWITKYNKSERIFFFKTGSFIEFTTFISEQDAKNGKRDVLYINEANGVSWNIAQHLIIKTELVCFIDYNPTSAFWAHDELLPRKDAIRIISDHRHNLHISQEIHDEIEYHPDPEWHRVYARGLTGNITGICFPNWKMIQGDEWRKEVKEICFGVDFGYTNDPTAIVKVNVISKYEVVLEELLYQPTSDDEFISQILIRNGANNVIPIFCDHDKELISLLRRRGLSTYLARKQDKGLDIMKIRGLSVFYTENSKNIHYERARYCFKKTDNFITNKPDDSTPNHTMDASRYGIYSYFILNNYFL